MQPSADSSRVAALVVTDVLILVKPAVSFATARPLAYAGGMRVVFAVVATVICLFLIGAGLVRAGEDPGQGLGIAAVFTFLLGLAWYVPFGGGRRKTMHRELRGLAQEIGATVRKAPHETILEVEIGGQPATIAWGFVKKGKRRIMQDSLRFEITLPSPLPRFRLINPRAFKRFLSCWVARPLLHYLANSQQGLQAQRRREHHVKNGETSPLVRAGRRCSAGDGVRDHLRHPASDQGPRGNSGPRGASSLCRRTGLGVVPL